MMKEMNSAAKGWNTHKKVILLDRRKKNAWTTIVFIITYLQTHMVIHMTI
jgi:hypothetical protein